MILLWGLLRDPPLLAVYNALGQLGYSVAFVDQQNVLDTEIELCVGATIEGYVRTPNQVIDFSKVTAAYLRPYDSQRLQAIERAGHGSLAWHHAISVDDAMLSWAELTQAFVVNRPNAITSNNSKPYQANFIKSFGFAIPDTLITTDPNAAREFWAQHGTVIYKSISSIRSIVSRLRSGQTERLEEVRWCPTQFQQYIPGNDYRVHVVGEEVFACEIISTVDDYRYAGQQGASAEIHPYELPKEIANRCRSLVLGLGLSVAGVDLRYGPDEQWYCFEVNPSPAFTYYQHATGHPIDEALARLLQTGSSSFLRQ